MAELDDPLLADETLPSEDRTYLVQLDKIPAHPVIARIGNSYHISMYIKGKEKKLSDERLLN